MDSKILSSFLELVSLILAFFVIRYYIISLALPWYVLLLISAILYFNYHWLMSALPNGENSRFMSALILLTTINLFTEALSQYITEPFVAGNVIYLLTASVILFTTRNMISEKVTAYASR